jgi:hypothetical protein
MSAPRRTTTLEGLVTIRRILACALLIFTASDVSAQDAPAADERLQYPSFLSNSFMSFSAGSIGYLFTDRQLEPGFIAQHVDKPRLAVRVDLLGHYFTKHLSVQGTYLRPARYVKYTNINGRGVEALVSNAYAGLTMTGHIPLTERVTGYVEAGGGVTSRSGIEVDGRTALEPAHYTSGMLGGGLSVSASPNTDLLFSWTYLPGRRSFEQPSTRFYTFGVRYHMRPIPTQTLQQRAQTGYAWPANLVRFGVTTNGLGYGANTLFSSAIPIFWGGDVRTGHGVTLEYQRNVWHTGKRFAFDLGVSASTFSSRGRHDRFNTLSGYPLFRFFFTRGKDIDFYGVYSLAGPTYLSRPNLDTMDTGARFTFQDFMGAGVYVGRNRRVNLEVNIKHFSNGNLSTTNPGVRIPLTFTAGWTF